MESSRLLELLKDALNEVPRLRELPYGNSDYRLWRHKVEDILRAKFGVRSHEFSRFFRSVTSFPFNSDDLNQKEYLRRLQEDETALKSIVWEVEVVGAKAEPEAEALGKAPKAFIAHGGKSAALNKLYSFLEALGVEPLVVEVEPSEGRLTEEQVDEYMKQADCAIVLATYGHIEDVKTRKKHPRLNVVDELGRCRKVFPRRTVLLLEKGIDLPSNVSGIVYEHFTKQNMENAFIKLAKELRTFGLIRPIKPAG
jgi:predicted nucleotide-binding protein